MLKIFFHRESGEQPAEATEYEGLDESDDVQEPPALHGDAVAGEEDGDGAVDRHGESEHQEPAPADAGGG